MKRKCPHSWLGYSTWLYPWQRTQRCLRCGAFREVHAGESSITLSPAGVGDVIRFSSSVSPVAAMDLGMAVGSGIPRAYGPSGEDSLLLEDNIIPAPAKRTMFIPAPNPDRQYGDYRVELTGTGATIRFTFYIPPDYSSLDECKAIGIPDFTSSGNDIDLDSNYGGNGQLYNNASETQSTNTYSFTTDQMSSIDISPVLSGISGGKTIGILVDHNGIGGNINYLGLIFSYNV